MPSFDIVSRADLAEVDNAVNNVMRAVVQRFDFKNSVASIERKDNTLTILAGDEMKLRALQDLLAENLSRRSVDLRALDYRKPERAAGDTLRQLAIVRQGIDADIARAIVKEVQRSKLKVQATIQGDQLRVTGKKRDDLQAVISLLKEMPGIEVPLQYVNFRD